jgi:hypothetical protein
MPRIYPVPRYGVADQDYDFLTTRNITTDTPSASQTVTWTDSIGGVQATAPSLSAQPFFNWLGPGGIKGTRFDGIANVLNCNSTINGLTNAATGLTVMQIVRPPAYGVGAAETYNFFVADGGTANASVAKFATGFSANNSIVVTGRRLDGGTRFVDTIPNAYVEGEEFILTHTVDYTGATSSGGTSCVWSVWKNDRLIYRQSTSSAAVTLNSTSAPAGTSAATNSYGISIGGSVINGKYAKVIQGEINVWKKLLSDSEILSKVAELKTKTGISNIDITSPVAGQAFQKNGSNVQDIPITGVYVGSPTSIQARFNGGSWQTIVASPSGGTFSGTLTAQAAGQGALEVRFGNDTSVTRSRLKVSVNDIYVLIGQSNNTDRTDTFFGIAGPKTYNMAPGMGPTAFNARQNFATWTDLDRTQNYPVQFAQNYYNKYGYPCAFIMAAIGGTNIAKWQPGANIENYNPNATDGDQFGVGLNYYTRAKTMANTACPAGVKAFFWHQGEADAGTTSGVPNISAATETAQLQNIAAQLATDFPGKPMLVARLQIIRTTGNAVIDASTVRAGQVAAWNSASNILPGPDLSDLECDFQAAFGYFHLLNNTVVPIVGNRWFDAAVAAGVA